MINLNNAIEIIEKHALQPGIETLSLEESHLKILAEDVLADRDNPPFDKSSMDGYACRQADLEDALIVRETLPAGSVPNYQVDPGTCTRIMTGAEIPKGADCVIMQEYTQVSEDGKIVFTGKFTNLNISYQGENSRQGDLLLKQGSKLSPQNIGLLAACGKTELNVYRTNKVGIIATGSELVEPDTLPERGEIRNSNAWQLMAQIRSLGYDPVYYGIVEDDHPAILKIAKNALNSCDILMLTGGASVGEFDYVTSVLEDLGFSIMFNKVAIQPGKPVTFAVMDKKVCFGLSGNPVSCFLQFELFSRPFLLKSCGAVYMPIRIKSKLVTEYNRKQSDRQQFLPVNLSGDGYVIPISFNGSAHLHAMNNIFGFAEIPQGTRTIKKGEEVYVRLI
jgi:molybdopterin molybdotransferase